MQQKTTGQGAPGSAGARKTFAPTVDVLIVGAGPTGLTLANLFQKQKVSYRLIDQGEGPSIWSKAQVMHARTLEQLQTLGLAARMVEKGKYWRGMRLFDPQLKPVALVDFADLPSRFPRMLSISQRDTELFMAEALTEAGGQIHRRTTLTGFEADADGVSCRLQDSGGLETELRCKYLVGCDGAHSTVRHGLNLPFEGFSYEERLIQADVRVELPIPLDDEYAVAFLSPNGLQGFLPLPGEKRYRMLCFGNFDVDLPLTLETFQAVAHQRSHGSVTVSDPHWMVGFKIHCRQVPQYQVGNVFLCGDAAHIHSPAGGQGMNLGIQDAYNLGWKLEQVVKGDAPVRLLESYHAERHPVAAATLKGTDTATWAARNVMGLSQPLLMGLRNSLLHMVTSLDFVGEQAARAASMLDTAYPDSPLSAEKQSSIWQASLLSSRRAETPSVKDWMEFRQGPTPGNRCPDPMLPGLPGRLFDLLSPSQYTLLLFDGSADTREGYKALIEIAFNARRRYKGRVQSVMVHPGVLSAEVMEACHGLCRTIHDPDQTLHKTFGAGAECLYLVRPDGYVAFRAQPVNAKELQLYLDQLVTPKLGT